MIKLLTVTITVLACMCAHVVSAQDSDADLQRAVVLFEESETLYNQGEFVEAAALLRRAYELHADPTLLFNLARALEGAGQLDQAIGAYEQYLRDAPEADDRGAVERRLQTLRDQRDRLAADPGPNDAEPEQAEQAAPGEPAFLPPWIVAGAGAVLVGAGAVFGSMSQSKGDEAAAEPVQTTAQELHDEAQTFATLANVLFVVGGLAVAGGVTWGVLSLGGDDDEAPVRAAVVPGGVVLDGVF